MVRLQRSEVCGPPHLRGRHRQPGLAAEADHPDFDRRGTQVPFRAISPRARPHHASHLAQDHTPMLRFIELPFDLPALTKRDANPDALLDAFDFAGPPRLLAPVAAPRGRRRCSAGLGAGGAR